MLKKRTSVDKMQEKLFSLLDRYPEEMREIIMTRKDKANTSAAAFFVDKVASLESLNSTQRTEVILAYVEAVWMAGFEAAHERSSRKAHHPES
ncbi:MAG: hypothetical protein U0401_35050 [Anaerolineae bacterium]